MIVGMKQPTGGRKSARCLGRRAGGGDVVPALAAGTDRQNAIAQGGAWSPRPDIAPPPGLAPLAELNVANGFPAFITRTADARAYWDRFAALIGPVTGPEHR